MSYPCTSPQYSCGETKEAFKSSRDTVDYNHSVDRFFTLQSGAINITVNSRARSYHYSQVDEEIRSNIKFVVTPADLGAYYAECFDRIITKDGTIKEKYTTTDCTFHYADLRNDLFVYEEQVQELNFSQSQNYKITQPLDEPPQTSGNVVKLQTSGDDASVLPFIIEEVPITITKKLICTAFASPLHEETINSGYWDGVRVLMPLFNGGVPRHNMITIEGVTYDAFDVDWYFIDAARRAADGDSFFWWADWHKAVGVNNEIDAAETRKLADSYLGLITPATFATSSGVITKDFTGSAAVDKDNNQFFSASFDIPSGKIVLSRLVVAGVETPIPQEKFQVEQPDGTFKEEDSQHDIYYPVAPL